MANRMYSGVKTWNPYVGCRFNCIYCVPSFQRQAKRRRRWCEKCYEYKPHFHPERLSRLPNTKVIFACAYGDIAFANLDWVDEIIKVIENHPEKTFYLQTKDPEAFRNFNDIYGLPDNLLLGVTLETNEDIFMTPSRFRHYHQISLAPSPRKRLNCIMEIRNLIDYITIEPILDFSWSFLEDLRTVNPRFIYVGYDNHNCQLPEPTQNKTMKLIEELRKFTEVRLKTIRPAWFEQNSG